MPAESHCHVLICVHEIVLWLLSCQRVELFSDSPGKDGALEQLIIYTEGTDHILAAFCSLQES